MQVNLLDNDYLKNLTGPLERFDQGQNQDQIRAKELKLKEDYYKKRSNAEANKYFDSIPEGVDISKLGKNNVYSAELTKWNQDNMMEIYRLKKGIKETEAGSESNLQFRQDLQKAYANAANLNNQLTNFKQYKTDYIETQSKGLISDANDGFKLDLLSNVYNDKLDMKVGPKGDIFFVNDQGYAKFNDLHDYSVVDSKAAQEVLNMNEAIYKTGKPMSRHTENLYRIKLSKMVGNLDTAKSLAADGLIVPGGLGVDRAMLHDPNRADELRQFVVDSYMESFKNVAHEGSSLARQGGGIPGTASGRKYAKRLSNMAQGFQDLASGNVETLNLFLTGNDEIMESEDEPGMYEYFTGDNMKLIDPNNPRDFYQLLKGQKIPDDLWPDLSTMDKINIAKDANDIYENKEIKDPSYYMEKYGDK